MNSSVFREPFRWEFEKHLIADQLGHQKYAKVSTAMGELICNSFDAHASEVRISLVNNPLGGLESVSFEDNGDGISPTVFQDRFRKVGVKPIRSSERKFGRFGLGRFAVYRLGSRSEWESTSLDESGRGKTIRFVMTRDPKQKQVLETLDSAEAKTGTRINVFNPVDDVSRGLTVDNLKQDLLLSFLGYLLSHREKRIVVNNDALDPHALIDRSSEVELVVSHGEQKIPVRVKHITLRGHISRDRFSVDNILFFGDGKLCSTASTATRCPSNYLALVESPYLSELLRSNRESIVTLDPGYNTLVHAVQMSVFEFQQKLKDEAAKQFLEDARSQSFYPFRDSNITAETAAKKALYDVTLEKIDEYVDLGRLTKKQQAVVFKLLNRAMNNSNVLDVLTEVASLSDDDFHKFRRVLERTTLQQIIRLSDEVSRRLEFLNSLHEIVYGDISKRIEERKQLHKILDQHCWIFGEKYQLSTSDKSFRTLIGRHRKELDLAETPDEEMLLIKDVDSIPDLYLTAQRSFPTDPKHHHLIVEIKAPKVKLKSKEVDQIKKYANVIRNSAQLSKNSAVWELFLVSSDLTEDVEADRSQDGRPFGLLQERQGINIWVFRWSELIQRAKDEMELVRNHLSLKTEELSISEDLKKEFPFLATAGA